MNDATPDKAAAPGFVRTQRAFAAHIRDPETAPRPADVEERRMAIYRDLFFNNVEGFLAGTFPVLKQVLGDDAWQRLARDFFAHHHCHSPLFLEIPREFLTWLEQERGAVESDPPFLHELAHYEWIELALSVTEADEPACDAGADLLATRPVLANTAWPFAYRFPVHRIGPSYMPTEAPAQPSYLLVYRDRDDEVGFLALNTVSARLFALLQEDSDETGRAVLERIAAELNHPDPAVVVDGGLGILGEWRARGIVLGGA